MRVGRAGWVARPLEGQVRACLERVLSQAHAQARTTTRAGSIARCNLVSSMPTAVVAMATLVGTASAAVALAMSDCAAAASLARIAVVVVMGEAVCIVVLRLAARRRWGSWPVAGSELGPETADRTCDFELTCPRGVVTVLVIFCS